MQLFNYQAGDYRQWRRLSLRLLTLAQGISVLKSESPLIDPHFFPSSPL